MFETAGPLANLQPVFTLVGLLALPLLWTLIATLARVGKPRAAEAGLVSVIISLTAAMATFGLTVVLATKLASLPKSTVLVQHVSSLGRLGQLDLALDLALDPRAAVFAVVVAIIACASALHTAWSTRTGSGAAFAWTGLATTGALLVVVSDGYAPLLAGLGVLSVGAWGLSRGDDSPYLGAFAGNVAILLGLMFLFWSLGGGFGPEGYDADGSPRFILVATGSPNPAEPRATLSMTSHAGALVSADDADLPGEPLTAPFAVAVDPGIYTLRVQGGVASADVVVPRVALTAGRTHVLTPYGPTASLHVLDDQIAVPRLAASGGSTTVRALLASRTIIGIRSSAIVLLLLFGGALAHAHALANRRGPAALVLVLEALVAPYLALRLAPLVDPLGVDGALVALFGSGSAMILAARAASVDDGHLALRGVAAAAVSIAVAAIGFGECSAALVIACAALVAAAAALAAVDARRDVRWLGVACAAAVGLLPGAGASSGYILAVTAALGSSASGSVAWAAVMAATAAAIVIATAFSALAAFRVYDALIHIAAREARAQRASQRSLQRGEEAPAPLGPPGGSRGQAAVVVVLAVLALIGGTALGAGTTLFGGEVPPLARDLASSASATAAPAPRAMAMTATVLCIIAAAAGVLLARRAGAATSPPAWLLSLGRPYLALRWTGASLARACFFLERSVRAMDRDVIEDVPAAFRDLALKLARLITRTNRAVAAKVDPPLEDAAGAIVVKLEMDDPRSAERFRSVLLLAMMALLGLVVLSSFVLR